MKLLKNSKTFLNKSLTTFNSNIFYNYSTKANEDHNITIDFDSESLASNFFDEKILKDNSYKINEILFCRILKKNSTKKSDQNKFSTKMFKLEKNGIFRTKTLEVFHEHIIHKSAMFKDLKVKNDLGVDFHLNTTSIYFKRPTLYEYIARKEQQAVSSHYSIISLAPLLLELNKTSRVLECGTGSGSMSLFLSQHLGTNGVLHTFDLTSDKILKAKKQFWDWKNSYDLSANENDKWPSSVKFGVANLCNQKFSANFVDYYDEIVIKAVYLDMPKIEDAVLNIYNLVRQFGVIVCNAMHLTQILRMLNVIKSHNLGLETELIIEPNNRFWDIHKIKIGDKKKDLASNFDDLTLQSEISNALNWTCRLEDRFVEKTKRGGMWFNYWPGYLCKLRKIR